MSDSDPLLYLYIVALLAVSAFFSTSETAISTVNRLRLRKSAEEGNSRAKTAISLTDDYDKTLYTILVGNNIVNIASSALATVAATAAFGAKGAVIATAVMTVLVIVFGEILPKSYGSDHSERVSLSLAKPLRTVVTILSPVTWVFMKLRMAVSKPPEASPSVTEEELIYMLGSIQDEGVIEEQERDLVKSALEFDEVTIGEFFTPRVDLVALDCEDSRDAVRETILEEGYSRVPVYEGSIDNIIGILYTRDYLRRIIENDEPENLKDMLTEPLFVHRTMKSSQLLARLRAANTHLAVVTDEYGGTLGIVTMEDLLEQLVGDIWDEDEDISPELVCITPGVWEVLGSYNADDFIETIGDSYNIDADYNTVNGWAGQIFGQIPHPGETARYKDLLLTVMEMDGHRIQYLRVERQDNATENQR